MEPRVLATVQSVRREAHDIVTIYFTVPASFTCSAGQYVTVFFDHTSTPEGKAYSLSSAPYESWLSITVKKVGEYSSRLHALQIGDRFTISPAYGFFNPETRQPLVCIAAGCGISPIWSILKEDLERDAHRVAHVFYSNKCADEIPFYADLCTREKKNTSLRVRHYITRDRHVPTSMHSGRIDLNVCARAVEDDAVYLVCGSAGFVRDIWRGLIERGVPPLCINTETFFE